ncbi:MAG: ABC transporter permease [Chloroflexota bacterium]|nr:ABC transporter permease [Chloroflexota bacterium]
MKLIESIRIAMRALAANKLRSVLTMLGIIIGVGSVIALMSIGRGAQKYVVDQFAGLGSNLLFIAPGQFEDGPPQERVNVKLLTLADMQAVGDRRLAPDVRAVSGEFASRATVTRAKKDTEVDVHATMPNYPDVISWDMALGNFFSQNDFDEHARVIVLGSEVRNELFGPTEYPLEQTVRVNNLLFRVVGVMEERGGGLGGNQDTAIFIPLTTAQDRLFRQKTVSGDYQLNVIYVSVNSEESTAAATDQITEVMRERRNISYLSGDDFNIISQSDLISVVGGVLGVLTVFLGAIAGISLLVGGIGIMNIMLVSVTERTREIGLRKAVGAKRGDVLLQFLVEAVTLSLVGGIIGISLGWGGATSVSLAFDSFDAVVGMDAVLIAFLFSMAVGLVFGIYPAYRASRLNPIDALRYE